MKELTKNDFIIECPNCGKVYLVNITDEELNNLNKWKNREILIQDALPKKDVYERELIRHGFSCLPMVGCCEE